MAQFDALDARTADAVGRVFADEVIWRPMLARPTSSYLQGGARPDQARPRRELPAIVTWAITGMQVQQQTGGGQLGTATLMVDFEWKHFEGDFDRFGIPKRGDWIEIPKEKQPSDRLVEITRVGDDGSARIWCWCSLVNEDDL
jgi:hypothetical protein